MAVTFTDFLMHFCSTSCYLTVEVAVYSFRSARLLLFCFVDTQEQSEQEDCIV